MNSWRSWWWSLFLMLAMAFIYGSGYYDDHYTTKRAISLSVQGDAAGAIEEYNKYLKKYPDDHMAYFDRGQNYAKLGQFDSAINDYNEAIRRQPNTDNSYRFSRANAFLAKGDYNNVVADFTTLIEEEPNNFSIYYRRGIAYQRASRFDLARADFEKFLSHEANNKHAAKALNCAKLNSNEGECKSLFVIPNPEMEAMRDKYGRCMFEHKCD